MTVFYLFKNQLLGVFLEHSKKAFKYNKVLYSILFIFTIYLITSFQF